MESLENVNTPVADSIALPSIVVRPSMSALLADSRLAGDNRFRTLVPLASAALAVLGGGTVSRRSKSGHRGVLSVLWKRLIEGREKIADVHASALCTCYLKWKLETRPNGRTQYPAVYQQYPYI